MSKWIKHEYASIIFSFKTFCIYALGSFFMALIVFIIWASITAGVIVFFLSLCGVYLLAIDIARDLGKPWKLLTKEAKENGRRRIL